MFLADFRREGLLQPSLFFQIERQTATANPCYFQASEVTQKPLPTGGSPVLNHDFEPGFHRVADCGKVFSTNPKTRLGLTRKIGSPIPRGSILYFFR